VLTRVAHWELAGLVAAGALACWLRTPTLPVALAACAAGIAAVALAVRPRPLAALLAGAIVLVGVTRILQTSLQVGQVERSWDADGGVRWRLVAAAGARLDRELSGAVTAVRGLAEAGVRAAGTGREAAFASLDAAVRGGGPERGVVVLEPMGRPWAWAGRHRMPASRAATRDSARLEVRITPFYAVLSAGRQGPGGREVVAHVLLAADSVVPDAGRGLGAQFARATGVRLEVFPPGGGPQLDDVFDYCVPGCRAVGVVPDTLFSVRLAPPAQGAYRAGLLSRGGAWGATATVLLFVTLVVLGGRWTRVLAVVGLALAMLLTPAGTRLPLGRLFSSAVYYADLLGPLTASSGALFVTAALATMAAVVLLSARGTRRPALAAAVVLVGAAPFVLLRLASGITPPTEGADPSLWLTWQAGLAAAGLALLLLAAALARLGGAPAGGRWGRAAALLLAPIVAAAGLATWAPSTGWPVWYLVAWVVPFALAVLPQPRPVTVVLVGLAAGANAVVLVWGAAADGRVLQADRDAASIRQGSDPIALGLLERFGATLERGPPPRNAAQLYQQWQRSPLESDRYPAVLSLWDSAGSERVRLPLAELTGLTPSVARTVAQEAGALGTVVVEGLRQTPDLHYVMAVPTGDRQVVTVGLGPRTRLIPPVRVARFLRGERVLAPPYTLTLGPPQEATGSPPATGGLQWRRDGRSARAEAQVEIGNVRRRLVADVPLGPAGSLLVRGTLVVAVDLLVAMLLWAVAEHVAGRRLLQTPLRDLLFARSYRRRLTVAFAVFFVVPTVGFASWVGARLRDEARRTRDVATRQTLAEAAGDVRALERARAGPADSVLQALAARLDADLFLYDGGALRAVSAPVLAELGAVEWYLDPRVRRSLMAGGVTEVDTDQRIAGRLTRVGYRDLELDPDPTAVLAAPRLLEDPALVRNEEDLAYGLLVVTLGGLLAAFALAALAARALATPVHALELAARDVGRGRPPVLAPEEAPEEFAPVMQAFERMAYDVRTSQAALEAARQRTAAVLRNVATGVVALDDTFRVVTSNPRAEELLGVELHAGDALGERSPAEWLPVWAFVRELGRDADDHEPREFTLGGRQVRVQVARLSGTTIGWVVALDDVTDLSHAVRILAWGELARQIAHEIKNPLTPIRLGVQHLRRVFDASREDFPEILDRTSRQILAEIERLDAIARAFSRFGAPPAGTEPLGSVDVAEAARDTAALYALGEQEVVRVEGTATAPARARRDELKEVLINLVENARAAGASLVTIRLGGTEAEVTVAVEDNGRGIPAEDLPRVLEPQFSTTTSGAGLGLAICRRLVESWDGRIAVDSARGAGTTVRLVLRTGSPG
jgi:two-component system, NtrC family, nitrogen regulation sensor histidine kinase NtrY